MTNSVSRLATSSPVETLTGALTVTTGPSAPPANPADQADIDFNAATVRTPEPRTRSERASGPAAASTVDAPAQVGSSAASRPVTAPAFIPILDDPPVADLDQTQGSVPITTSAALPLAPWISQLKVQGPVTAFTTPSPKGLQPFTDAINNAQHSVRMGMYHITSQAEIQALINAKDRLGAENVTVLLDGSTINANNGNNGYAKVYQQLVAAGVNVVKSSPAFSITHEKDLIVDAGTPTAKAILSSVNLTNMSATTRDYGIITSDPGIIQEWTSVFNADLENAKNGTANTPPLSNPNLVFSPVDAEQKLVDIINSAADSRYSVTATSESLTNKAVVAALQAAAARGVNVQLIVPEYIEGSPSGAVINYPALRQLNATPIAGTNQTIQARVMPYPATVEHPYMHGKMLLVSGPDGDLGYIGSVNLSTNSLEKARECGFVFNDQTAPQAVQLLKNDFASDWQVSIPPPTNPTPPAEG